MTLAKSPGGTASLLHQEAPLGRHDQLARIALRIPAPASAGGRWAWRGIRWRANRKSPRIGHREDCLSQHRLSG